MSKTIPDPEEQHVFNDDLLMNRKDLDFVRMRFPRITHIFDNPSLRAEFAKYDKVANGARAKVRVYGLIAVTASTIALIATATSPLWPHAPWTRWLAAVIELSGMIAAIIAIGGIWSGKWKRRWLHSRLMTERLRQWHFQYIVRSPRDIEASCKDEEAIAAFQKKRDILLAQFLMEYKNLDSQLESVINDPLEKIAWLHELQEYKLNNDIFQDVYDAYELLRFEHQYGYAMFKLDSSTDKPFWRFLGWPPSMQWALLSRISSSFFMVALILSAFLICESLFASSEVVETYLRTAAIVVALVGAALRTIQEGLGLDAEIDRYREYRQKISRLHDRFKRSTHYQGRLELMDDLEYASVEEMQDFFRTHQKATFVLA
jgi:hypothetical protein